ncbi:hypothetical protein K9M06_02905 [Candidatus Bipolaricaulota bacterium]|nr:hypothetical protein [Candidatus Bipolaricaulota bacterium]
MVRDGESGKRDNDKPGNHGNTWQEQLRKFEKMGLEEKFDFFYDKYEDPEVVGGDFALEMLDGLLLQSSLEGKWEEYLALDEKIRKNREDLVETYPYWLSRGRTLSLIWSDTEPEDEEVETLFQHYVEDPDVLTPAFWALVFRAPANKLTGYFRRFRSEIEKNDQLMPRVIDEFIDLGIEIEIYSYLSEEGRYDPSDVSPEELIEEIDRYYERLNRDRLRDMIRTLGGKQTYDWEPEDFTPRNASGNERPEETQYNDGDFFSLVDEFHRFLHTEEGLPWCRGRIARDQITGYLLRRIDGELEIKYNPRANSSGPTPEILLPDSETFEEFLNEYLHFLNPDYYKVATPFIYINSWLKFLLEKSLIERSDLRTVINDLESLKTEYEHFYREKCPDPEIMEAFQSWPETVRTESK